MDQTARLGLAWLTAGILVTLFTPFVRRIALRQGFVAKPVSDRWGKRVVARLGGVALFAGVMTVSLVWVPLHPPVPSILFGCAAVFVIGLIDDFRRMAPYTKLLCQLVVGALVVMGGIRIELIRWDWVAIPLSVCWLVLVMNAFNLLDNMDGLAAGVGAITAGFCALHALLSGHPVVATMAAIVSGACLGFLRYNFPPAKIYMGDSGSHLLGFTLGTLALLGTWRHSTQLLSIVAVPLFVLAVPIFDTCFVTIQRLMHRTHPFQGGTDHVSHRLAILGLSQRQTVLMLYGVSVAFGLLSLLSAHAKPLSALVILLLACSVVLLIGTYLAKVKVYQVERGVLAPQAVTTSKPATLIETMLLHKRRLLEVLVDFSLICSAYVAAHVLRFEGTLPSDVQRLIVQSLPIILAVRLACFAWVGLYRGVWRYVSLPDVLTIAKGVTLGSLCSAFAVLYLWRFEGYSRAVFIIDWLLLFLGVSAARVTERLMNEWIAAATQGLRPVLIIGAGDTGELVLRQMKHNGQSKRRVVGFLDDDARKQGNRIHGRSVLGARTRLHEILQLYQVREVFIAMGKPPADLVQQVKDTCERQGVRWSVVTTMIPED